MESLASSLSPEMEDYLETIAALFRTHGEARVTDIAERLSVSKAGVSQALRTLSEKQLVHYRPYVSPTLTDDGLRIAERVQRRHDVMKQFLIRVLLLDPVQAETNACRLEHAVDKEVLESLAQFMDFVQHCPRGGEQWIRGYKTFCDKEQNSGKCEQCMQSSIDEYRKKHPYPEKEKTMTLADLKPGQTAKIVRVGNIGTIRRRIVDMGAVKGTDISLIKVAPLGDPMEIKIKGYNLTLRKKEAEAILIESKPVQKDLK